jgi:hypothetical protein
MDAPNRWRIARWTLGAVLLLLPLTAMAITDAVDWTVFDFLVAAVLVGGVGLAYEVAVRTNRDRPYRAGAAVALATGFLLLWLTGAVGIVGSEKDPANLLHGAVVAIALFGAAIAGFRAAGIARAMTAAAIAQVLVVPLAGATGARMELLEVVTLTAFFTLLWLASAGLFHRSARRGARRP